MTIRNAEATWPGSLREGTGEVALDRGATHAGSLTMALAGVQIVLDAALD